VANFPDELSLSLSLLWLELVFIYMQIVPLVAFLSIFSWIHKHLRLPAIRILEMAYQKTPKTRSIPDWLRCDRARVGMWDKKRAIDYLELYY